MFAFRKFVKYFCSYKYTIILAQTSGNYWQSHMMQNMLIMRVDWFSRNENQHIDTKFISVEFKLLTSIVFKMAPLFKLSNVIIKWLYIINVNGIENINMLLYQQENMISVYYSFAANEWILENFFGGRSVFSIIA